MIENASRIGARGLAVLAAAAIAAAIPLSAHPQAARADGPVLGPPRDPATQASLRVRMRAPKAPLLAGGTYTWPYAVKNGGPQLASSAHLAVPLHRGLTYVPRGRDCSLRRRTVVCDLGRLKPGQVRKGGITAKISGKQAVGRKIDGTVTVTYGKAQITRPLPKVRVAKTADVWVKVEGPKTVQPREAAAYEVTVGNDGPSPAKNVRVTEAIRSKAPLHMLKDGTDCRRKGGTWACDAGTLPSGAKKTFKVKVRPGKAAKAGDLVRVRSAAVTTTPEVTKSNNKAGTRTEIRHAAPRTAPQWRDDDHHGGGRAPKPGDDGRGRHLPRDPRALPNTGSNAALLAAAGLGLAGTGLVLYRTGRSRRRECGSDG
ncbi:LPXTG cell wall anchor domain-containing protein [Thermomonospora umbrina]|uniref:LPXTG-motif cell wall-anchored protein/uncharacterized repeat protein (TIGR01451 family) n=1 Tax=Thermomonospora umbrina TaxID=111806 RepID=A0A3D9SQU0_9ACTN|nr:LPXTG cell wall anchor domain-containing protein [Thermomonospora umbrina]REE95305.1 LPXTG-motif cell wall-anchored protein/uncharacterized repeat protein (TIGR01451 family) [Thermomonospora umbrina]